LNRRDEAKPPDATATKRFELGHKFGEAARKLFPEGRLVEAEFWQIDEALAETQQLLADHQVEPIFEAAFLYGNIFLRADVIVRVQDGGWDLWEVKSVAAPGRLHKLDLAIQAYVMAGSLRTPVRKAGLIHLARGAQLGNVSASSFAFTDFSAEVSDLTPTVVTMIHEAQRIADSSTSPLVEMGEQCTKSYSCPFVGTACKKGVRRISDA
jgi:hypothetical protein